MLWPVGVSVQVMMLQKHFCGFPISPALVCLRLISPLNTPSPHSCHCFVIAFPLLCAPSVIPRLPLLLASSGKCTELLHMGNMLSSEVILL